MYKYFPCILPADSVSGHMRLFADRIAEETDTHPPHLWTPPHLTLHRPIVADEREVRGRLARVSSQAQQVNLCFSGNLDCYRNEDAEYFVLPAQTPLDVASLWVAVHEAFSGLPGYERIKTDGSTTLHAIIAKVTPAISKRVWPKVREFRTEPMTTPVTTIDLFRKPTLGGKWEIIDTFPIPA